MSEDLVLHLGAAKTGSSAIQRFIQKNVNILKKNGYVVPDRLLGLESDITGEHVFALQSYINDNMDATGLADEIDNLVNLKEKKETLLLSAENLSNLGRHLLFKIVGKKYNVKAVLYIRRQDELLASAWQQWHSKIESDLNAWLISAVRNYGQWERLIADWESIIGEGRVTVRVYDYDDFPDNNISKDFAHCLGLDQTTDSLDYETGNVNPTFSEFLTPLVAGNRNIFKDSNDSEFYQLLSKLTGSEYIKQEKLSLLTSNQREAILGIYSAMNLRICRKYFPGRPYLFKPLNHSEYYYIKKDELVDKQLQFLTEIVYQLAKRLEK